MKKQFMKILAASLFAVMVLSGCRTDSTSPAEGAAESSKSETVQSETTKTENAETEATETEATETEATVAAEGDVIGSVAPCGTVFGNPLYIGYADDFGDALEGKASVAESYSDDTGEEKVWIYIPGGITQVSIIPVSFSDDEWLQHGQRLGMPLKGDEILELVTTVPESYPNEAIVCYSEDMEEQFAYAIGYNGETGGVQPYLIEITGVGEAWYNTES